MKKSLVGILALSMLFAQSLSANVNKLYTRHCEVCHGDRGQGGLGSSLIDEEWVHGKGDEEHARIISRGLPELGMQGFGDILSEKEIRSLVIYMQELKRRAEPVQAPREENGIFITRHQKFRIEPLLENPARMWGVSFLPGERKIVTEIDGAVRILEADGQLRPPLEDTPRVVRRGQGGMLDVAVHPDYRENGWIYLAFAEGEENQALTTVVRGRVRENRWVDQEVIFRADEKFRSAAGVHFGTRIAFHQGYLFFSIGDRGAQQLAQDPGRPNGKIFRLHDDGRIPADNPSMGKNALPGIWSTGHRNPQALTFRPGTDELWSTEHGPRGGDELNRILPGRNYGWPTVTHGMNYNGTPITEHTSLPGLEDPVWYWTPSIATCGMAFADVAVYPGWEGDLILGGLRAEVLERLRLKYGKVEEREIILKDQGRVRDVKTGPDGLLYVILEANGSRLVRLVPAS